MKSFSFLLFFLFTTATYSQTALRGTVVNAETGAPVPAASIFLANTSVGTTAAVNGTFTLAVPAGRYDLVVSSVGFETHSQTINSSSLTNNVTIRLQPKAQELETVVVQPFEKDGWEKWGSFFLESFIGRSAHAKSCVIKNRQAIKFRHSKKDNTLTAIALEPLVIENKALGYTITYQLEAFSYDFKTHYLVYQGYPFFQPMKGGGARQRQWAARRREVYEGSIMHFMRSLYRNTIAQEGFEVRRLQKIPNTEKERVKLAREQYRTRSYNSSGGLVITDHTPKDSSAYYSRILAQPDFFDIVTKDILPGDSIAYAINPTTTGFFFQNYLLVNYTKKLAPKAYIKVFPKQGLAMTSQLLLPNSAPLEIHANGSFYNPIDLLSQGYWAWSEKMAAMLPYDYVLPQKEK